MAENNERNLEAKLVKRTDGRIMNMVPTGVFKGEKEIYQGLEKEEFKIVDPDTGQEKTVTGYPQRALSLEQVSVDNQIALMNEKSALDNASQVSEETQPRSQVMAELKADAEPSADTGSIELPVSDVAAEAGEASEQDAEVIDEETADKIGGELLEVVDVHDPNESEAIPEAAQEAATDAVAEEPVVQAEVATEEATPAEVVKDMMDMPKIEVPAEETKAESDNGEKDPDTVEALSRVDAIEGYLDTEVADHQAQVDRLTDELEPLVGNSEESIANKLSVHRAKLRRIMQDMPHGNNQLLGEAIGIMMSLQEEMKQASTAIYESKLRVEPLRRGTIELKKTTEEDTPHQLEMQRGAFTEHAQRTMEPKAAERAINEFLDRFVAAQNKTGRIADERSTDIVLPRLDNLTDSLSRAETTVGNLLSFAYELPDSIRGRGLNDQDLVAVDSLITKTLNYFEQARGDNERFKQIPKPQPKVA